MQAAIIDFQTEVPPADNRKIVDDVPVDKTQRGSMRGSRRRDVDAGRARTAEAARQREDQTRQNPGTEFKDCAECPSMITVPAGGVTMGSSNSEIRA